MGVSVSWGCDCAAWVGEVGVCEGVGEGCGCCAFVTVGGWAVGLALLLGLTRRGLLALGELLA